MRTSVDDRPALVTRLLLAVVFAVAGLSKLRVTGQTLVELRIAKTLASPLATLLGYEIEVCRLRGLDIRL